MPHDPLPTCPHCSSTEVAVYTTASDRSAPEPKPCWDVVRCGSCGLAWTSPEPTLEQLKEAYREGYHGRIEQTIEEFRAGTLQGTRSWKNEVEKVRLVENLHAGGRILDLGCGDGKFLWALDSSRWQRVGAEFNEEVVETVARAFPEIEFLAGDVWSEALEPESFDLISLWHVLEHLPEPRRVLVRLRDLLAPGGTLVLAVPNLDSLQARLFKSHWYGLDVPRHLYHFSFPALGGMLQAAGLELFTGPLPFSTTVGFHHAKHSLLHWSREKFSSSVPYYLFKAKLFPLIWAEAWTGRRGVLAIVARRPHIDENDDDG